MTVRFKKKFYKPQKKINLFEYMNCLNPDVVEQIRDSRK